MRAYTDLASLKPTPGITDYTAIAKAALATEPKVRLVLARREYKRLPKDLLKLAHLPYLELDLRGNDHLDFEQAIDLLRQLPGLRLLILTRNVVKNMPPTLGDLTQLRRLTLWNTDLTKLPDTLANLSDLEGLNLGWNKFATLPDYVYGFQKLTSLDLSGLPLGSLDPRTFNLTALERLTLNQCRLRELPEDLGRLTRLQRLDLGANNLRTLPAALTRLKALTRFDFRGNRSLNWPDTFEKLSQLPELKHLNLSNYNWETVPEGLELMQQVETLDLSGNLLQHPPDSIRHLKNLRSLDVYRAGMFADEYLRLLAPLPRYTSIALSHSLDSGREWAFPDGLDELVHVEDLHLSGFAASTALPEGLGRLPRLRRLSIASCPRLTHLPESLGDLPCLESLTLDNLPALTRLPASLGRLKSLRTLTTTYGSLPALEGLPDSLADLPHLQTLSLRTGAAFRHLPPGIFRMQSLQTLRLTCPEGFELPPDAHLPRLENVALHRPDGTSLVESARQLGGLAVNWSSFSRDLTHLPEAFAELVDLTVFEFYYFPNLVPEPALDLLARLPKLRKLDLGKTVLTGPGLPEALLRFPALEDLTLGKESPVDFADLLPLFDALPTLRSLDVWLRQPDDPLNGLLRADRLDRLVFNVGSRHEPAAPPRLPLEAALLRHVQLRKWYSTFRQFIEAYRDSDLDDEARKIRFSIWEPGRFDLLHAVYPNPFADPAFQPAATRWAILGRMDGFRKADLLERFARSGLTLADRWDDSVTHVVITPAVSDDELRGLARSPAVRVPEGYLREHLLATDDSLYLRQDDALTEQVLRLLFSDGPNDLQLAFQLIEGSGASPKLVTYLFALHLFHRDAAVRKQARGLFKTFAPAGLQAHVKAGWKDSLRGKHFHDRDFRAFVNVPDLDQSSLVVALAVAQKQRDHTEGTTALAYWDFPFSGLPSELPLIENLTSLSFGRLPDPAFFESVWNVLPALPHLITLSLHAIPVGTVPARIFESKALRDLSVTAGDNLEIEWPQTPSGLKNLSLEGRGIRLPDLRPLRAFTNLNKLLLRVVGLTDATALADLPSLRYVDLSGCPLATLRVNWAAMRSLVELRLNFNALEEFPENLELASALRSLSLGCEPSLLTSAMAAGLDTFRRKRPDVYVSRY